LDIDLEGQIEKPERKFVIGERQWSFLTSLGHEQRGDLAQLIGLYKPSTGQLLGDVVHAASNSTFGEMIALTLSIDQSLAEMKERFIES